MTDWDGKERRGIAVEVMNFVQAVVEKETTSIKNDFAAYRREFATHDAEEMDRYREILDNQKQNAEAMERRYSELTKSVNSYAEKAEQFHQSIKEAFLVNRHGKPDFVGHANAHEAWVKNAEDNKKLLREIRTAIIIALAVGVGGWLLNLTWAGILVGPK